jgi:hypothetical protein
MPNVIRASEVANPPIPITRSIAENEGTKTHQDTTTEPADSIPMFVDDTYD